jgi:hypothetical protein
MIRRFHHGLIASLVVLMATQPQVLVQDDEVEVVSVP